MGIITPFADAPARFMRIAVTCRPKRLLASRHDFRSSLSLFFLAVGVPWASSCGENRAFRTKGASIMKMQRLKSISN